MTASTGHDGLSAVCRDWAITLTRIPSVNGTANEALFAQRLLNRIAGRPALAAHERWLVPVENDPLGRSVVALLVRGKGRRTVILTGHFDTVPIDDYGALKHLALEPELLKTAMLERLRRTASSEAERRALADLESGDFLPGRGLLDMKAGLAAGLAVCEAFAASANPTGNLLFLAVPDEEANSAGARQLAKSLGPLARDHALDPIAAINLDSIADDGDGAAGRAVTQGSIGKLLLTAFVAGRPAHACYPFAGINAGTIAGAIAAEVEWAPELSDLSPGSPGMPPTLLSLKDSKPHYDVTTPAHVWATWNMLYLRRDPRELLDTFTQICRHAATEVSERLATARSRGLLDESLPPIEAIDFSTLLARGRAADPDIDRLAADTAAAAARDGHNLPEQCRRVTEAVWQRSGIGGPIVITGFGSLPYLPVVLGASENARWLASAVERSRRATRTSADVDIAVTAVFPGISDISFLGEADLTTVPVIAANTPAWRHGIAWPAEGAVAGIAAINAGPWGRDYHTPLERMHTGYGFDVLPRLLSELTAALLPGP
jgi:arginine utilization protein RocB